MKLIFVLRHSKAEHNFLTNDFERLLTDRGKKDILKVAKKFKSLDVVFDEILCSSAKRTTQTIIDFANTLGYKNDVRFKEELYHAPKEMYYKQLSMLGTNVHKVLIVAHNPGITDFVNSLGIVSMDNMPTSGLFGFVAHTLDWSEIATAKKEFLYFDYPKNEVK